MCTSWHSSSKLILTVYIKFHIPVSYILHVTTIWLISSCLQEWFQTKGSFRMRTVEQKNTWCLVRWSATPLTFCHLCASWLAHRTPNWCNWTARLASFPASSIFPMFLVTFVRKVTRLASYARIKNFFRKIKFP